MQLASAPREFSGQNERDSIAVQTIPAREGNFRRLADHCFCQRKKKARDFNQT
jgi:hypothetical protein